MYPRTDSIKKHVIDTTQWLSFNRHEILVDAGVSNLKLEAGHAWDGSERARIACDFNGVHFEVGPWNIQICVVIEFEDLGCWIKAVIADKNRTIWIYYLSTITDVTVIRRFNQKRWNLVDDLSIRYCVHLVYQFTRRDRVWFGAAWCDFNGDWPTGNEVVCIVLIPYHVDQSIDTDMCVVRSL